MRLGALGVTREAPAAWHNVARQPLEGDDDDERCSIRNGDRSTKRYRVYVILSVCDHTCAATGSLGWLPLPGWWQAHEPAERAHRFGLPTLGSLANLVPKSMTNSTCPRRDVRALSHRATRAGRSLASNRGGVCVIAKRKNANSALICFLLSIGTLQACASSNEAPLDVKRLALASPIPPVAVHVSAMTTASLDNGSWLQIHPNMFLEEAFVSDGTPFVEVTDSQIAAGGLVSGRYPILFSLATECISDAVASKIRDYVEAGGTAYVGSSAWTRKEDCSPRTDAGGRPAFAIPEIGLASGDAWANIQSIVKVAEDPMIDHLSFGLSRWMMAPHYRQVPIDLDGWPQEHGVWRASRAKSGPANAFLLSPLPFPMSVSSPPALSSPATAELRYGDVNRDRRADMVYRQGNLVYVRLSTGNGFSPPSKWTFWSSTYSFDIADVNGDQAADIVGRSGSDVQVGLSNGVNGFSGSTRWTLWSTAYTAAFADVDGDGDADIVGRNGSDVQVGRSTGTAGGSSFSTSSQWTNMWPASYMMSFADVDGDLDADLVGRGANGDVKVAKSNGKSGVVGFALPTHWTWWSPDYSLSFADVDGDGKSDAEGRLQGGDEVQVGLSSGTSFYRSQARTTWAADFTLDFADVDADGTSDALGVNLTGAGPMPLGDVEVSQTGSAVGVELAVKDYGSGRFIYNAEIVPLAGYGGFANDNSEYKTIRAAILRAYTETARTPLVTLAPWPFPNRAAVTFRHDHVLGNDEHQLEMQLRNLASGHRFGDYYLFENSKDLSDPACPANPTPGFNPPLMFCCQVDDYVATPWPATAVIGAHIDEHSGLDGASNPDALLKGTIAHIVARTGLTPQIFAAPVYLAVTLPALQSIARVGFLAAGEQGAGPFPHFTLNPEGPTASGKYVSGAVLQIPTSEWPGDSDQATDDMERMSIDLTPGNTFIERAARLAHEVGGLVNVYDHVGGDVYLGGCNYARPQGFSQRAGLAKLYLDYVNGLNDSWITNALELREWWLRRDTYAISASFQQGPVGTASTIDVTISVSGAPKAPTRGTPTTSRHASRWIGTPCSVRSTESL